MQAFTRIVYGGPEVLQLRETPMPVVKEGHLLVKVVASSVNPADGHILRGRPLFSRLALGLFRPKRQTIGADFSGVVVKTGSDRSAFNTGDRVFGEVLLGGAFAEYISVPESACTLMPADAGFYQMAAVPLAGLTALQALLTHGKLKRGERVLINGASGGVGHFAVQLAKVFGAQVTAVCSSKSAGFVRSLGADAVIAYDEKAIHQHDGKYDLVVDIQGNLTYADYKRMGSRGVMVGFTTMRRMLTLLLRKAVGSFPLVQFTAHANRKDLDALAVLIQSGGILVHIEKRYAHADLPAAIRQVEAGRTKGKVLITWDDR